MNKLVCSIKGNLKKVALLEGLEVKEMYAFNADRLTVGDIVIGRVSEKVNNINAFFVDIGNGKSGFLPMNNYANYSVGDILPLEIIKEGKGNKHPKLSSKISLAGAFSVYMPQGNGYNVAKSITDEKEKERLEHIAMDVAQHVNGNIMIRSAAVGFSEAAIRNELEFLKTKWQKVSSREALGLAAKGLEPIIFFMAKHHTSLREIVCDNADFLTAIKNWGTHATALPETAFSFHASPEDLFSSQGLDEPFAMLLEKEVRLAHGGRLIIEPTAALVAIDVDSGANGGNLFNVNLEAAKEAIKQIRLRNLSGQMVIDLIKDRRNPEMAEEIAKKLYRLAKGDSVNIRIAGATPLGNIEVTRERRFAAVYEVLGDV